MPKVQPNKDDINPVNRQARPIRRGKPVDPRLRIVIAHDVHVLGDLHVAREIGVSVNTLARVLGGLIVYGVTAAAVRGYVERRKLAA